MWKVRFVFQQGIWSNGNRPATTIFTCSSLEVYMFVLKELIVIFFSPPSSPHLRGGKGHMSRTG
uniref:Uncharacterized protein n=1 Tax=Anguilla anguilla TaxID=7936 RepID=A0A0E9X3N9_ANGAN